MKVYAIVGYSFTYSLLSIVGKASDWLKVSTALPMGKEASIYTR